jgi:hypothetical protein
MKIRAEASNLLTMKRTPVPHRVDLDAVQELCRQRRGQEMLGVWLPIDDVESLLIEAHLYRNKYDSATRRQKDGARAHKPSPPKITLENTDRNDESPGG